MSRGAVLPAPNSVDTVRAVRCRPITEADLEAVVRLLVRGFGSQDAAYWRRGLARCAALAEAGRQPRRGFVLEAAGELVGVVLTLWASGGAEGGPERCNLSSWYVDPAYRAYAALLDNVALRDRSANYFNVSAAPHTWPIHEARGFRRYATGLFLGFPVLNPPRRGVEVEELAAARLHAPCATGLEGVPARERRLLVDHASYGCIVLVARDRDGTAPFVFVRRPWERLRHRLRLRRSPLSYLHLVYCRSPADLPRFAHAIGRHLLRHHRMPWIVVDAVMPIPSLAGRYLEGTGVKFSRGPDHMPLGDLAYSELALFAG